MESLGDKGARGLIRHRTTGQYYRGDGQWTNNVQEAMQFESLSRVVSEAQRFGIEGCSEFIVELNGRIGFRALLPF